MSVTAAPRRTDGPKVAKFCEKYLRHRKGIHAGERFVLEPFQRQFLDEFYELTPAGRRVYRYGYLGIPRGNGKALELSTPVPTPAGWTTMGEVQVGDLVFGPDGEPTRVIAATPPLLGRPCYRLRFSHGEEIVADAWHLWLTEEANRENVPMLRRTWEIADTLLQSRPKAGRMWQESRHRVRLAGPLQLPEAGLPVDPYVLGCWLGDGDSDDSRITIAEPELVELLRACGYELVEERGSGRTPRYRVTGLKSALRELGVLGDKRVPSAYLRGSVFQRLALLQGLMDTDGTVSLGRGGKGFQAEFVSMRRSLAESVLELAVSLGLRANLVEGRALLEGRDCGPKYRVTFGRKDMHLFRLTRKRERQIRGTARLDFVRIVACDPVDSVPVRCITVERPDGMYLVGRRMVPTHNTPLMAGLGLLELLYRKDAPDVFTIAGAKEQARILQDFARGFVEDNERLGGAEGRGWVKVHRNFLSCHENHGVMKLLASAGLSLHGLNPSAALIDELHAIVNSGQEETFNAILTALHKRPDSFMLTATTAGYDKDTILGRAYDSALQFPDGEDLLEGCLRIRRDRENGVLFYWYGIPESLEQEWQDERLWRLANPASWVNVEDLRKQLHAPGFHELDWKRLHANMWTKVREAWLPSGAWASCRGDLEIPDGAPVYVGIDVGMTHDTTAVAWAWKASDTGPIVVRSHVWSVLPELPHHEYVAGGRMRLELVGLFLRSLGERYRLMEVVFDPAMFTAEADRLSDEGVAPLFELNQNSSAMTEAYMSFYQAVREQKLMHDGDPVLAAHVESTAADRTERGWRPRKLKSTQVIDACVATTMAHARAARSEQTSVYERGGLFEFDLDVEEDE